MSDYFSLSELFAGVKNAVHAIPALDWEAENQWDVAWAKRWLDEVTKLTGVRPVIYMSESVVNSYDWSSVVDANYGLWVAKYLDYVPDANYDMTPHWV